MSGQGNPGRRAHSVPPPALTPERRSNSGVAPRSGGSATLKGPHGNAPWSPPPVPRRIVPAPPPPTSKRPPAVTLKQNFGLDGEDEVPTRIHLRNSQDSLFPEPDDEGDATRSWGQAESVGSTRAPARQPAALWGDSVQEPTATTSVTQGELENLRRQLQLDQNRKSQSTRPGYATGPQTNRNGPSNVITQPVSVAPAQKRPFNWLNALAVLSVLGLVVVAHQSGHLRRFEGMRFDMSRFDVSRLTLPQLDVRPLLSALENAQANLAIRYEQLFSANGEGELTPSLSVNAASPQAMPTVEPLIPTVQQLDEADVVNATDKAVAASTGHSGNVAASDVSASTPADLALTNEQASALEAELGAAAPDQEPSSEENTPERKRGKRASRGKGVGVLRVNALPWADIYADGKLVGRTPELHLELAAGVHQITLKNTDHGLEKSFSVKITSGRVETRIVNLQDAPAN